MVLPRVAEPVPARGLGSPEEDGLRARAVVRNPDRLTRRRGPGAGAKRPPRSVELPRVGEKVSGL